jgi:hypothetical protein
MWRHVRLVLDHSKARGADRLVLVAIAERIGRRSGVCWPSQELIAKEAAISVRQVQRSLRALRDMGELDWERRGRRNQYRINISVWDVMAERERKTRKGGTPDRLSPNGKDDTRQSVPDTRQPVAATPDISFGGTERGTNQERPRGLPQKNQPREAGMIEEPPAKTPPDRLSPNSHEIHGLSPEELAEVVLEGVDL